MQRLEFAAPGEAANVLVELLTQQFHQRKTEQSAFSLAVSGGGSALHYYKKLFAASWSWERVSLCLTDERCVSVTSPLSNLRQLCAATEDSPAASASIWNYLTQEGVFPASCTDLSLNVAVLGMGADGHIASLFTAKDISTPGCYVITQAPDGMPRVSLGMDVFLAAESVFLFCGGKDKLRLLDRIEAGRAEGLPVAMLFQKRSDLTTVTFR